jgi:beta-carotene 3-hydroxylase
MIFILDIAIALFFAVLWEGVAWFTHKYLMHGFLWILHEDHHRRSGKKLQKNDLFAIFFAGFSFVFIFFGLKNDFSPLAAAGFGIALYGIGYVLFHDIMFHHRIKGIRIPANKGYLRRIVNAHRDHHKQNTKENSRAFYFLWAPVKYHPQKDI